MFLKWEKKKEFLFLVYAKKFIWVKSSNWWAKLYSSFNCQFQWPCLEICWICVSIWAGIWAIENWWSNVWSIGASYWIRRVNTAINRWVSQDWFWSWCWCWSRCWSWCWNRSWQSCGNSNDCSKNDSKLLNKIKI